MTLRFATIALIVLTLSTSGRAQAPTPSEEPDGHVHVALTLENQEVRLAYLPDLSAEDSAHASVLASTAGARVTVGTLTGHRALRIGSIAPDLDAPASSSTPRYEVRLAAGPDGWALEAQTIELEDVYGPISIIPLAHQQTHGSAPTFTASLRPTAAEAGLLVMRWGSHVWSTDFRFDELPPAPRRPRVSGRGQARTAESDTTAFSRGTTLAERNEAAVVLADGARISTLFWKSIDVEDEDYASLDEIVDGQVVRLVRAPPLRLKSDVALRFGATVVPTGNVAPGYAGAYAVWLRRVGDAWKFVFNDEADSWGTQHDAEYDRVELDATYSRTDRAFRPLAISVEPQGARAARLAVHWGPHEWTADFTVSQ